MEEPLFFSDRNVWRTWLSLNHNKVIGVWLVFYKKKATKTSIPLKDAVEEAICFGWIDGKLKRIDTERFIVRFTPRKSNSVWSKINRDNANLLIASGQMTTAGLAKIEEAKKSGAWDNAYSNSVVEPIPCDLRAALEIDPLAWKNFYAFANTYRNSYVGWINQAKTSQTRQRRIRKVVEQALKNKKQVFL